MTTEARARGSVGRLLGVLVIAVLGLAGISLFAIQYHHQRAAEALARVVDDGGLLDLARRAQVDFKVQVQEWKNVLLRSPNAAEYAQRWKQFTTQEDAVTTALTRLAGTPGLTDAMRSEAEAMLVEHQQLGVRYRTAAAAYVPGDPRSLFAVDAAVRGIDRNLNQRLDTLADGLRHAAEQQADELRERGAREYDTLRLLVSGVAGVVIVLAGLLAIVALRSPRTP